ncbi:MAG: FtsQ-type POTRA domain-containing protein [Candidatus Vogelbacteria bacterium]|nr:FtsQ-type POTRA domain-containing protein [Candidatus Vogelbacteria bacterium]
MGKPVDARKELFKESKKRSLRRRKILLSLFIGLVVVFLIGFVLVLRLNIFIIQEINIVGNKVVKTESLMSLTEKRLAGNYLFVIPKNNNFLFSPFYLGQNIIKNFPDIENVTVQREGFTKLEVKVSERSPKLLWCLSAVEGDECFYADKTGFLFAPAPNFSDNILFKVYGLIDSDPIGGRPLSAERFSGLLSIIDSLPGLVKSAGITPAVPRRLTIDRAGDCRVLISGSNTTASSTTAGTWTIVFNQTQDLPTLASNLNTVFATPEFQADLISADHQLDYIDLRFGKKVFYKFK